MKLFGNIIIIGEQYSKMNKKRTNFHLFYPKMMHQQTDARLRQFSFLKYPFNHNSLFTLNHYIVHMPLGEKIKNKRAQQKLNSTTSQTFLLAGRYEVDSTPIGKGVSSVVMSGMDLQTHQKVAVKKVVKYLENKQECIRILREISLLRMLEHPNIIKLREIVLDGEDKKDLYLILDYYPFDMKRIFKSKLILQLKTVKAIVYQTLAALNYCHQSKVLHRDLKPENILLTEDFEEVKMCDFGLARSVLLQDDKLSDSQKESQKQTKEKSPEKNEKNELSVHVATRWYRAPELIILQKKYNSAIDIWSIGCILGELIGMLEGNSERFTERKALFPGKACYPLSPPADPSAKYQKVNNFPHSTFDQLSVIFEVLGTPEDLSFITDEKARRYIESFGKVQKKPFTKIFNFIPPQAEDFLQKALAFNPNKRLTISDALKHPFFDQIRDEYEQNIIEGEPVTTEIEDLTLQQIRERVIKEEQHYQKKRKQQC